MVNGYVRSLCPDDQVILSDSASFEELGIDSMSTIDLLLKVEKEFGVKVPDDMLAAINNVGEMVDFIAAHKGAH